jgi:drug/metabolite transporter (DMT)-like permease
VKPRELLVLLVLGGTWGSSFLFIKVAVDDLSPLMLVEGRMLLGAVTVVLATYALGLSLPRSRRLWLDVTIMAVFSNVVPFALISWAEQHIASGTASVLNASMALFTAMLAPLFIAEEGMTTTRAAGLLTGFLGVAVFSGADLTDIFGSSALGELAVVAAAACYAVGAVFTRLRLRGEHPLTITAGQLVSGVVLLAPVAAVVGARDGISLHVDSGLSMLALGVVNTGFAYVTYLWLLAHAGAVKASLVTYVIPVTGLLLGWAVLDETVGPAAIGGLVLIVAGVTLVNRAALRQPRPATDAVEPLLDKERPIRSP